MTRRAHGSDGGSARSTGRVDALDRSICRLVLGTSFGGDVPQRDADRLFDRYVERGGDAFDTALVYFDAEERLGRWMASRGNRDAVILHAKGAHHATLAVERGGAEIHAPRVEPRFIREDLDATMARLSTDRVDLYVLHRDDPDQPVGPIVECLAAEHAAGRIRAFGASNWTIARIEEANAWAAAHGLPGFATSSPNFALAFPNEPSWPNCVTACDAASRAWYGRTRMPLFAWSALALGFFGGEYRPVEQMTGAAIRRLLKDPWTSDVARVYFSARNFERRRRAAALGENRGATATQIALAWVLAQPMEVFAVVGPRTVAEIDELFDALAIELSPAETAWLDLAGDEK